MTIEALDVRLSGAEEPRRQELLVGLGAALAARGLPSDRVEAVLERAAAALDLPTQVFCTPTSLFLAIGRPGRQTTHLVRVRPGPVDLGGLGDLEALVDGLVRRPADLSAAEQGLARLGQGPVGARGPLAVAAFAVCSACAALFLGGGVREGAVVLGLGLLLGWLAERLAARPAAAPVFEPLAATLAAVGAGLAVRAGLVDSAALTTVATLIVLVPGFSLTVAMGELATGHWASGSARLAGSLVTFLAMGFGVALGRRLVPVDELPVTSALPEWVLLPALVAAGLAFAVLFAARRRDAGWIVLGGLLAFGAARWGGRLLGPELGAFGAALLLAVASHLLGRWRGRASLVTLVPGLVLLVPGSVGMRSVDAFLASDAVSGMAAAFQMGLVAVSLVAGLLLAHLLVPAGPAPGPQSSS